MTPLETMTPGRWQRLLDSTYSQISASPQCAPILGTIGDLHFQLCFSDRPELAYWEQYGGGRVVPHLGVNEECTVLASTTFHVLVETLLQRMSIMEAAADELWEVRGDTEALMRCANLLPHVMTAFAQAVATETFTREANP